MDRKLVFLLLCICLSVSHAQEQTPATASPDTCTSSQTWTYVGIGGAAVLTLVMFEYDQQVYDELYAWKMNNPIVHDVSPVITDMGDGAFSIGLFGGWGVYGLIWKDRKAFEVAKVGFESFLFTGIVVQIMKNLCGRERPSASTRPGGFWHGPLAYAREPKEGRGIAHFDAFPSGHTATVFSAATTIADYYTQPWVSYTCYTLATLTSISRITESTHWISDCFVGAIIGHYGTKLVERWNGGTDSFTIIPHANDQAYGLIFSVKL